MNEPDDDRKRAISEQWWPGLLCLVFWVLLIIAFFVATTCIQTPP
jgi:hypothetical protein